MIKQIKAIGKKNEETGEVELMIDEPVNKFVSDLVASKKLLDLKGISYIANAEGQVTCAIVNYIER